MIIENFYERREFEFTSSLDSSVPLRLVEQDRVIQKLLLENLKIQDYTDKFTTLFVIYQIFASDDPHAQYKEKMTIRRKTNIIELYLNPDYEQFKKADETTALRMLAETYLYGIETFLAKRKNFNHAKFYADVRALFEKEGWVVDIR